MSNNWQGKRGDQVRFSELVTALCVGGFGVVVIGWPIAAWVTR